MANGTGLTINGTTLAKVLAGVNGVLLAISVVVISLASTTLVSHGDKLADHTTDIAVIQGNRFTSQDALNWENRVEEGVANEIRALRTEMNARFDRLETRIGGGF